MKPIIIIEGHDLQALVEEIKYADKQRGVYAIRIHPAEDGSGLKAKVNAGTWTYWIGKREES